MAFSKSTRMSLLYVALMSSLAVEASCGGPSVQNCSASYLESAIDIPYNGKVLDVTATSVQNYPVELAPGSNTTVDFCNVTVTFTHPAWNDTIHVWVYLPESNWNGRFQGIGGGGWATTMGLPFLLEPVATGYSAGTTDGGHNSNFLSSAAWAEKPDGQLNMPLLKDFASVALYDLAIVGKQVTNRFYGYGPNYSYWNGCSTGGRQGLMMAQRYPSAYDGIYAACPAINWETFQVAQYWGQFWMNQLNHYPPQCVFDTITAAAVATCGPLGDGVIPEPGLCMFDPDTMVGKMANCSGTMVPITHKDALITKKTWEGPRSADGTWLWWGINPGTPFSGLTDTTCTGPVTNCTGFPFGITTDWIARWILQEPDFDFNTLTLDQFTKIFNEGLVMYNSIIGTDNPDLHAFKASGGKMITWHGLADQLIYPGSTINYYHKVKTLIPDVHDFYRFFPAPGVHHCGGGAGATPSNPFQAVVDWVEKGIAPDTLTAVTTDGKSHRNLCLYPKVAHYTGGDPADANSYICKSAEDFIDSILSYTDSLVHSNASARTSWPSSLSM